MYIPHKNYHNMYIPYQGHILIDESYHHNVFISYPATLIENDIAQREKNPTHTHVCFVPWNINLKIPEGTWEIPL